jgi:hypothetical protein
MPGSIELHLTEQIVCLFDDHPLDFYEHIIDGSFARHEKRIAEVSSDTVPVVFVEQHAGAVRPGNQLDAVRLEIGMLNVGITQDPNLNHDLLVILMLQKERLERVHRGTRSAHDLAKDVDIDTSRV